MSIVPHPDLEKLQNDCELLHDELLALIVGADELTSTIIPNIEAEYQLAIGHLEYKQFCIQVEINKFKRKIEIIQASINHGDMISEILIDEILNNEFEEWEDKLREYLRKLDVAKMRNSSKLSIKDSKTILELYRKIAKKLHPDVNHELYTKHKNLWLRAVESYNNGALESLKALWVIAQDFNDEHSQMFSSFEMLEQKKVELKKNITQLLSKITNIKSTHPYTLNEKLLNNSWVKEQQTALQKSIAELFTMKIRLKMLVDLMLKEN